MGTDAPVMAHGRNLEEISMTARYGMSPAQAWAAATRSTARLTRLDDELGTLESGKRADLVVLDGDLDDVADHASSVRQVWQDGRTAQRRDGGRHGAGGRPRCETRRATGLTRSAGRREA